MLGYSKWRGSLKWVAANPCNCEAQRLTPQPFATRLSFSRLSGNFENLHFGKKGHSRRDRICICITLALFEVWQESMDDCDAYGGFNPTSMIQVCIWHKCVPHLYLFSSTWNMEDNEQRARTFSAIVAQGSDRLNPSFAGPVSFWYATFVLHAL